MLIFGHHFPRQLFRRFLLQQLLGVLPALLVTALIVRFFLSKRLSTFTSVEEATAAYNSAFLTLSVIMAISVTAISLWTGYRLVLPLGRILVKARGILKRDFTRAEEDEWDDLESALHRIGRDMQKQELSLTREREEIEAIMSAITEAVVAIDETGNLLFFNSRFAVLFGDQDARKTRLSDFLRNPDVLESFRETFATGAANAVSTQIRLKDEPLARNFSLSLAPLRLVEGKTYGVVGVFHDVSELKRMDQVRIDFVANVSHELSTPLTSIRGYAEMLKEDLAANPTARSAAETIERNTDRLISLVRDLLSLSSLESGTELEKKAVDLAEFTAEVVQHLDPLRERKRHQLQLHCEVPVLYADPKRLEQVLTNLVENAIKYVPEGGKIQVVWDKRGREAQLHVIDNGPGISPEHQARIFERFYRVDSARGRDQGGTGLGLAIVKHIVQRHGGRVRVQSANPHGTEFICSFPLDEMGR